MIFLDKVRVQIVCNNEEQCLVGFKKISDIQTVLRKTGRSACTLICKSMTYDRADKVRQALKKFPGAKEESFDIVEVSHRNMFRHPAA